MDKFTTIHGHPIKCIDCKENEDCYDSMDCDYIYNAIKKLSYYENLERHGLLPCMQDLVGKKCYKIVGNGIDKPRIEEDVVRNFQIKINDNYSAGLSIFLTKDEAEEALEAISKRITFVDAIKSAMVQLENEALRSKSNLVRAYAFQSAIEILKNEMKKAGFDSWS